MTPEEQMSENQAERTPQWVADELRKGWGNGDWICEIAADLIESLLSREAKATTGEPSGAEEMREALVWIAEQPIKNLRGAAASQLKHIVSHARFTLSAIRAPIATRPTTGGTDGRTDEEIATELGRRYLGECTTPILLAIAAALRSARATTEARSAQEARIEEQIKARIEYWNQPPRWATNCAERIRDELTALLPALKQEERT